MVTGPRQKHSGELVVLGFLRKAGNQLLAISVYIIVASKLV
jgi:hypothetical protein